MKNRYYLITFLFFTSKIYSQIPVRTNVQNMSVDNSAVPAYDSLSNFTEQKQSIDYLKFIGQELYLPPAKKGGNFGIDLDVVADILKLRYKEIREYIPDTVIVQDGFQKIYDGYYDKQAEKILSEKEKYKVTTDIYNPFITLGVNNPAYGTAIQLKKEVFDKTYLIIDITNQKNQRLRELQSESPERFLRIWLKTSNNDTIFFDKDMEFADKSLRPFVLMAYYNKNVEYYKKKDFFVFDKKDSYEEYDDDNKFIDINTGERIKLEYGNIWNCVDISLIETEYERTLIPFYILKNKDNKEIKIPFGELIENGLISIDELNYAYQIWLENEKNIQQNKNRIQKEFEEDCIKKFGNNYGIKIANGKFELGMSKQMILYGFGSPFKTLYSKSYQGIKEIFFYNKTVFYFQDDKLINIIKYS